MDEGVPIYMICYILPLHMLFLQGDTLFYILYTYIHITIALYISRILDC